MPRDIAHCMPIYLLGSLQYFADVRTANAINAVVEQRYAAELRGIVASINDDSAASGVGRGEGEGRT